MTHFRIDVWPTGASDLRHLDSRDSLRVDLRLVEGRVYFLRGGTLKLDQVERLCREVLSDPVTEEFAIDHLPVQSLPMGLTIADSSPMGNGQSSIVNHFIDVTLLPGVTDSVAENLLRAAHVLGIETLEAAASGQRVHILSKYSPEQLHQLALDRYANPVIQRFTIDVPITPPFVNENEDQGQVASNQVETVSLMEANAAELLAISKDRRLSLDLAEMQAIQTYYRGDGREPTDIELEMLAQTWSEHCVHKTFKAIIDIDDGGRRTEDGNASVTHLPSSVDGLLKSYIRAPPKS